MTFLVSLVLFAVVAIKTPKYLVTERGGGGCGIGGGSGGCGCGVGGGVGRFGGVRDGVVASVGSGGGRDIGIGGGGGGGGGRGIGGGGGGRSGGGVVVFGVGGVGVCGWWLLCVLAWLSSPLPLSFAFLCFVAMYGVSLSRRTWRYTSARSTPTGRRSSARRRRSLLAFGPSEKRRWTETRRR